MTSEKSNSPARWMLVDDDDDLRGIVAKLLAALASVEVVGFSSGAAALSALTAAPDSFDFVVSDLDMPVMSGIEFCRQVHAIQPRLKVLLTTGSGLLTTEEARDCGFCGLIAKPFSVTALRRVLAEAALPGNHQPDRAGMVPMRVAA